LRSFETVRKSFRSASDHRDLLEDYQEELEEYVGELEKRDSGADDGKEDGDTLDSKSVADESADDDEEKTEELKKPDRPRRRPELQVLLRALDNEIPVRVTAHRSEEILNALALAEEFNLQLILVGATEAHLLIDEIKEQGATVLIAPAVADLVPGADVHRREHPGLAGLLSDHDIPWVMGSGARDPRSSRLLWMEARRLVSGSPGEDPFALVTRIPARHLGMGRRFGRLARGLAADLVIWSSDPEIDPTARAKRVLVDGKTVYRLRAPARREGSL